MKAYLAARFTRRDTLQRHRNVLSMYNWQVTSRWIDTHDNSVEHAEQYALEDIADIKEADVVLSFTEEPDADKGRGGRHVEFGVGLALGKTMVIVGPREGIFHYMPDVLAFDSWEGFLVAIDSVEAYARVRVGAKWLDSVRPNWHKDIDPTRLYMADCDTCVLGQVFDCGREDPSGYERAQYLYGLSINDIIRMGFEADDSGDYYRLQVEWEVLIRERNAQ